MSEINEATIYDTFWTPFCDALDTLETTHKCCVTYEPSDETHYISSPNGETYSVKIEVKEVK